MMTAWLKIGGGTQCFVIRLMADKYLNGLRTQRGDYKEMKDLGELERIIDWLVQDHIDYAPLSEEAFEWQVDKIAAIEKIRKRFIPKQELSRLLEETHVKVPHSLIELQKAFDNGANSVRQELKKELGL